MKKNFQWIIVAGLLALFCYSCSSNKAENEENEAFKYISNTSEYRKLVESLNQEKIAHHHIVEREEDTGFINIVIMTEHGEHNQRRETFVYDPQAHKCFIYDLPNDKLNEIQK